MTRFALGVEYRGSHYCGWQKQRHREDTVQQQVERALSQVANHTIETVCAGRTDTGVHGTGQVIHFESDAVRSLHGWQMGTNTHLPYDVRVTWVREVSEDFHARFSAQYRRYHYVIADNSVGSAIFHGLVTPYRYALNAEKMNEAAQYLLGEQDFSSFRASQCQSNTPFRCVDAISVKRHGEFVVVDIQANAFLYHMVRNIVGALLVVGREKQSPIWLSEILLAQDRCKAPPTASADGLYLVEVGYDSVYNLPTSVATLPFLEKQLS